MHAYLVGVCSKAGVDIGRFCLACFLGLGAWGLGGGEVWAKPPVEAADEAAYKQMEVLARALNDIETRAVTRPSLERLVRAAIGGMLREIDSNSHHLSAKELEEGEPSFEAGEPGLVLREEGSHFLVEKVREGSPAQEAGIRPGDVLLSIDGQPMSARSQLTGPLGSHVALVFKREDIWQPLRFRLKRVSNSASPLETHWVDSVWVVHLSHFSPGVAAELAKQLPSVVQNKSASILLDLRGNSGGLLQEAFEVLSLFLPPQTPVVRIQGPQAAHSKLEKTVFFQGAATQTPMLVLVDRNSASVAEVVAAAFKDNGRAHLLGERSHGKGSIQEKLLLPDGSALYLTVARFVRLTGAKIDAEGVEPDCNLHQAKSCKGLKHFPPKLVKSLPTKHPDLWLEWAVSWLLAP